jgi:hypothetical protein
METLLRFGSMMVIGERRCLGKSNSSAEMDNFLLIYFPSFASDNLPGPTNYHIWLIVIASMPQVVVNRTKDRSMKVGC